MRRLTPLLLVALGGCSPDTLRFPDCPQLTVRPAAPIWTGARIGVPETRYVDLVNNCVGDTAIEVHAELAALQGFAALDATFHLLPGEARSVTLTHTASDYHRQTGVLRLQTDSERQPVIDVALAATVDPDQDRDGVYAEAVGGADCEDAEPRIHPGAAEVCDGLDNDCDGIADNGISTWFDEDGDGWGDPARPGCETGEGWVPAAGDCRDDDPDIHPGAVERCDGVDNDCDGDIDAADSGALASDLLPWWLDADQDGFGDPNEPLVACGPVQGAVDNAGDCDDTDPAVHSESPFWRDGDGDGFGAPPQVLACAQPSGHVPAGPVEDCDDAAPGTFPGAPEACDGEDSDCDGIPDSTDPDVGGRCLACDGSVIRDLAPVVYWRLGDVATQTVVDHSGNGNTAIAVDVEVVPGIDDDEAGAALFVGPLPHVHAVTPEPAPSRAASVSVWYQIAPTGRIHPLVSYVSGGPRDQLYLALGAAQDQLIVKLAAAERTRHIITGLMDPGWHHLALTWDGLAGVMTVYLDGSIVLEEPAATGELNPVSTLFLGQHQRCWDGCMRDWKAWHGVIDEFALFDRVLSAYDIRSIFAETTCGEGLVCDGVDNDEDGIVDEHLLGTVECPAPSCAAVDASGSNIGAGTYVIERTTAQFDALQTIDTDWISELRVADLDADGDDDLVGTTADRLVWYERLGAAGFGVQRVIRAGLEAPRAPLVADVDGDGDSDVLVATDAGIAWFENLWLASGSFAAPVSIAPDPDALALAAGDVDLDGDTDVLWGGPSGAWIARGLGGGTLDAPGTVLPSGPVTRLLLADLDGASRPDIVFEVGAPARLWWARGTAVGFLPVAPLRPAGAPAWDVQLEDLDGDGDPDLLLALADEPVTWHENLGGSFAAGSALGLDTIGTASIAVDDLDVDGDLDLVCATPAGALQLDGASGGGFEAAIEPLAGPLPIHVAAAAAGPGMSPDLIVADHALLSLAPALGAGPLLIDLECPL